MFSVLNIARAASSINQNTASNTFRLCSTVLINASEPGRGDLLERSCFTPTVTQVRLKSHKRIRDYYPFHYEEKRIRKRGFDTVRLKVTERVNIMRRIVMKKRVLGE